MADGLYAGDPVGHVIEKTLVKMKNYDTMMEYETNDSVNVVASAQVNGFYSGRDSDKLFADLCVQTDSKHEGLLAACEDDCRKKRCVDRYDSSESSDSGVATLSCTDCSGSSTASSDITDPGSPFSTASNHSEDSGGGQTTPVKMPPAQSAHHWPWTASADEGTPAKRPPLNDTNKTAAFSKRLKLTEEAASNRSPPCVTKAVVQITKNINNTAVLDSSPTNNNNNNYKVNGKKREMETAASKMQQGKITEYFKTQIKSNGLRKLSKGNGNTASRVPFINQMINPKPPGNNRKDVRANSANNKKARKFSPTIPRKILPAPNKIPKPLPANTPMHNMHSFTPTVTLTAVSFPTNLTYLHAKAPKTPDNIFVPQFATLTNDKVNSIPIINRNQCLNVIQPVQKIANLNNFNCMKLNATVVPIVNINALPPRLNGSTTNIALSVDTAVPTVIPARPKVPVESGFSTVTAQYAGAQYGCTSNAQDVAAQHQVIVDSFQRCRSETLRTRTEEPYRTEECQTHREEQPQEPPDDKCWSEGLTTRIPDNKSPSPVDSDSGISSRCSLEISVDEPVTDEPKKSPILSQPKTIRFPAPAKHQRKEKEHGNEFGKSALQSNHGRCRWDDCAAQFDTSGALLEHLQVKHVISQSQANQEQYVCLWRGCKVHGRRSCSISWLERHVLAHAGTKPFRCIVDGCGLRFNSQLMLERHVNNHFNSDGTQNTSAKKSVENGSSKLFKRNGRIIRFRRQPWSARMFDFIDSGIMEGLQHKLLTMTQVRTMDQMGCAGETVNLRSQIVARRTSLTGSKEVLVRWHPADVSPDEWVSEKEYKPTKMLPIPSLSPPAQEALQQILFPCAERRKGRKHSRKPLRSTT